MIFRGRCYVEALLRDAKQRTTRRVVQKYHLFLCFYFFGILWGLFFFVCVFSLFVLVCVFAFCVSFFVSSHVLGCAHFVPPVLLSCMDHSLAFFFFDTSHLCAGTQCRAYVPAMLYIVQGWLLFFLFRFALFRFPPIALSIPPMIFFPVLSRFGGADCVFGSVLFFLLTGVYFCGTRCGYVDTAPQPLWTS